MAPPLAARFLGPAALDFARAGTAATAEVEIENVGTVEWRSDGMWGIQLAYHWLDGRGNPLVWDGLRTPLPEPVPPGGSLRARLAVRVPLPPGAYRLAVDLIEEGRHWFAELGNRALEQEIEVLPRLERRALAVRVGAGGEGLAAETQAALSAQEEPLADGGEATVVAHLAPGCLPPPDWSRRVLDAHDEGYAAVGGSLEPAGGPLARRRAERALAPWAPGRGRVPGFAHALVCPSFVAGLEPAWVEPVEGLPAALPPRDEPWLWDGRLSLRLRV